MCQMSLILPSPLEAFIIIMLGTTSINSHFVKAITHTEQ